MKPIRLPICLSLLIIIPGVALAEVDWISEFNDKPVAEEQKALILKALPDAPIAEPDKPRRVLVFSATAGFRHKSIPHGKLALKAMGEATGAYEAIVSDDPDNFEKEKLKGFDAIILLSPTSDFFMPGGKQRDQYTDENWATLQARHDMLVDNLVAYVKEGGGLVGIHAATDACFNHKEYGETIGGYFDGHPWRSNNHVTIVVEDPEHVTTRPVFHGIQDFELTEEIYQFKQEPYSREKVHVLLRLDPERSDKVLGMKRKDNDYPVAWVNSVGDGRVFYSSIGHNNHIFWNPLMLKHYLAGIQYACGDLVTVAE